MDWKKDNRDSDGINPAGSLGRKSLWNIGWKKKLSPLFDVQHFGASKKTLQKANKKTNYSIILQKGKGFGMRPWIQRVVLVKMFFKIEKNASNYK